LPIAYSLRILVDPRNREVPGTPSSLLPPDFDDPPFNLSRVGTMIGSLPNLQQKNLSLPHCDRCDRLALRILNLPASCFGNNTSSDAPGFGT
jgi:hypothetical protein